MALQEGRPRHEISLGIGIHRQVRAAHGGEITRFVKPAAATVNFFRRFGQHTDKSRMQIAANHELGHGCNQRYILRRQIARQINNAGAQRHRAQIGETPTERGGLRKAQQTDPRLAQQRLYQSGIFTAHQDHRIDAAFEQGVCSLKAGNIQMRLRFHIDAIGCKHIQRQVARAAAARTNGNFLPRQFAGLLQRLGRAIKHPHRFRVNTSNRGQPRAIALGSAAGLHKGSSNAGIIIQQFGAVLKRARGI